MPAHLHHELVAGATATRCLALVHGIYGAGANWRSIAKKLVERRPEWAVALIDLRHHGRSLVAEPPDTLAACADDLRAAIDAVELRVTAIAGHSFGGKVALATRRLGPPIDETWVLDASPSAGSRSIDDASDTVIAVLQLMERLPRTWPRREDFIAALVDAGQDVTLARWLAMNVVADGDAYTLRLDLTAIRAMLTDYFAQDVWDAVTAAQPGTVEFVIADRARTVSAADRQRLQTMPPHVHVHHVDAGHWLHIDAPSTIIDLFAAHL